jgi:hypothetical protein
MTSMASTPASGNGTSEIGKQPLAPGRCHHGPIRE